AQRRPDRFRAVRRSSWRVAGGRSYTADVAAAGHRLPVLPRPGRARDGRGPRPAGRHRQVTTAPCAAPAENTAPTGGRRPHMSDDLLTRELHELGRTMPLAPADTDALTQRVLARLDEARREPAGSVATASPARTRRRRSVAALAVGVLIALL